MPGTAREQLQQRAGVIVTAIVVTVLVAVGALIAGRGGSAPPASLPTPGPVKSLPLGHSLAPNQLLRGDAATFDHGTGGWTSFDGHVTSSGNGDHSAGALSVTGGGGSMSVWSPVEAASAGDRYVGSMNLRGATAAAAGQLELRFIDAAGTITDTEVSQPLDSSTTGWVSLPVVAGISPAGTTQAQLGVSFPTPGKATQLIDDASLAETPGGHARIEGPLTTRGNQILDGTGAAITLRGLQRFGLEGGTANPLPTQSEINQLSQWGANEVRISLGEQKWVQTACTKDYEPDYPQVVDRVVRWVTSRGMVALLNLHFAALGKCSQPGLTPMADSPAAITFWQQVASRYKDNDLVAFDLFNEPYNVSQSVWLDGGTFSFDGQTLTAAGMQQLYDTVRGTGADNLIVISGLSYANQPPTEFVDGTNIVYGVHAYTCPNFPPPQCTYPNPYDPAPILARWKTLAKTYPVMVSEFGWPNGDSGLYNAHVIADAEADHWSWSGFAWDGGTGGLFDLVQAHPASDGTTIEPNAGGMALVAGFALNWPARP